MINCVNIENVSDLLNEISSNKILTLSPGEYSVSNLVLEEDENVYYEDVYDGKELILSNLSKLTLKSVDKEETRVLSTPRYSNVITFKNCDEINIENLTVGHTEDAPGSCIGGVLKFNNCQNVVLNNLILFGCGTYGIILENVKNFKIQNTIIKECTLGILQIFDSENVKFIDCIFKNNMDCDLITISNSKAIIFTNCDISDNFSDTNYYFFDIKYSQAPIIRNTLFKNNQVKFLARNRSELIFEECNFELNDFDDINFSGAPSGDEYFLYEGYNSIELPNESKVLYSTRGIRFIKKDLLVSNATPSTPVFSKDMTRFIYISPFEWEVLGDLHLFDVNTENDQVILSAKRITEFTSINNKIKLVKWYDSKQIICIIGQAYGTVSIGGNVYIYNIDEDKFKTYYSNEASEEVKDFTLKENKIILKIAKFDEEFTSYEVYEKELELNMNSI